MRRIIVLVLAVALALPLAMLTSSPSAIAASNRLPDLRMARLTDLKVEETSDNRRLLRFNSVIVNVGTGPFEAHGQRSDTDTEIMTTTQRIFDDAGGYRDRVAGALMVFGGDGHDHWHVRDLERFTLNRLNDGRKAGTGAKHGFCFYDNYKHRLTRPDAPQSPYYTDCGGPSDLDVTMGLSVGWGDIYSSSLPDQYIEITDLPSGRYRLRAMADAGKWFKESNERNNHTWADISLTDNLGEVKVISYGPSA